MIALGSDHGGYKLKEEIKRYLEELGIDYKDFGTNSEERTDYPLYASQVCESIQRKECDKGILICKTGFGMTVTANKYKGIRCAPCYDVETAKQAKEHINVNVLALPAGYIGTSMAINIIRTWIASQFLNGRYEERIQMINEIEDKNMK